MKSLRLFFCTIWLQNTIESVMNIAKLNLAELVGEVMDKIVEFQIFCHSVKHEILGFRSRDLDEGEC